MYMAMEAKVETMKSPEMHYCVECQRCVFLLKKEFTARMSQEKLNMANNCESTFGGLDPQDLCYYIVDDDVNDTEIFGAFEADAVCQVFVKDLPDHILLWKQKLNE